MGESIIHSEEMRLRMSQLEYDGLSEEEFKREVERIYIEEYGKKPPGEVEVYSTSNSNHFKNDDSGYEGTAVHFRSDTGNNNTDEVYVISQGTQDAEDWEYNIKAMLAGQDTAQAEATDAFVKEAKEELGVRDSVSVTGLSHSLAHNNNATAHLLYDTFDDVYSVNGAQTNYYQIFNNNYAFESAVKKKFSLSSKKDIYDIDPDQLKTFANDYFKDEGEDIHQLISEDDPLYAVSGIRGFFTLGDVEMVDTNPDYPGLRNMMDDIPDNAVKDLQELAVQYSKATKNGDVDDGIQALTGVNMDVINQIDGVGSGIKTYFTHQSEIDQMVRDLDDKLPTLMKQVQSITDNSDTIFQKLVDAGYINSDQKKVIVDELGNIQGELDGMQDSISTLVNIHDMHDFSAQLGGDAGTLIKLKGHYDAIQDSLDKLNKKEFTDVLQLIGEGHDISGVLAAVSGGKKSYKGGDMFMTGTGESGDIQVNMSAALSLYDKGQTLLDDKKEEIKDLQSAVEREIEDCYQQEKKNVKKQIDNIEANPSAYSFFLQKHFLSQGIKKVERIYVYETFEPLKHSDMEDYIDQLNKSVEKEKKLIEDYRSSIEDLFDEEANVAAMFDLAEEVFS